MSDQDLERQAAVFDAIGARYHEVFADKEPQIVATRWLIEQMPEGGRVLDAGCGTGEPTTRLLVAAGLEVVGVDISEKMLELAREAIPGARFERKDMAEMGPDTVAERFDGIAAFFSLLMLPRARIESALARWVALLGPGGHMALSMVEADLDYVAIPFMGQVARLTGYPRQQLEDVLRRAGLEILAEQHVEMAPNAPDVPPEHQLFYMCRVAEPAS